MSTAATVTDASAAASPSPPSSFLFHGLTSLGLGYAIGIAFGLLVLLSALLLASYFCCRSTYYRSGARSSDANLATGVARVNGSSNGVVLPRVIFVAEDEEDEESGDHRNSTATGLDQAVINRYPRFQFSATKGGDTVCSICLGEYREGEILRMMPDCSHYFHLPCIDEWLRLNASCPVCRTSPMPTPLSTPLSELVPLSHYAADQRRR